MRTVLHSFAYAVDYLPELLDGVGEADMVAQPGGIVNHPAWTVGHLTGTCQLIGGVIGLRPWLADDWAGRFGTGSVPVADAGRYEPKDRALAMLRDAQARISEAVLKLSEARLNEPFPDPSLLDVFPTVRHALTQVLVGHTAMHVGQLTVWRRAMGLPAMKRAFE